MSVVSLPNTAVSLHGTVGVRNDCFAVACFCGVSRCYTTKRADSTSVLRCTDYSLRWSTRGARVARPTRDGRRETYVFRHGLGELPFEFSSRLPAKGLHLTAITEMYVRYNYSQAARLRWWRCLSVSSPAT